MSEDLSSDILHAIQLGRKNDGNWKCPSGEGGGKGYWSCSFSSWIGKIRWSRIHMTMSGMQPINAWVTLWGLCSARWKNSIPQSAIEGIIKRIDNTIKIPLIISLFLLIRTIFPHLGQRSHSWLCTQWLHFILTLLHPFYPVLCRILYVG